MQTYEIIVSGRAVHANSADTTLVRTSIGIDKIHVLFDNEEWTSFPVRVTFANGDTIISTSLTLTEIDAPEWAAEAECNIPWEVIQDLGGIRITFQGTDASGNHIITEASGEPLSVVEAGDVGSGTVPSPAPSVDEWNQAYANAMAAANSASGAAESANEAADRANTAAADAEQVLEDGIPLMDADTRGGAKLGDGLEVDENEALKLSTMSATQHGGATLGSGLRVDDGALSLGDLTQSASGAEVPTDGCAIFHVEGEGWSEQESTTGKNLFDLSKYKSSDVTISGDALSNVKTDTRTVPAIFLVFFNGSSVIDSVAAAWTTVGAKTKTFTTPTASFDKMILKHSGASTDINMVEDSTITGRILQNTEYTISANMVSANPSIVGGLVLEDIQLEPGDAKTSYEPYTGGAPSPSPDYPQEIEVARGRNLLDESKVEQGSISVSDGSLVTDTTRNRSSEFISVEPNTVYTATKSSTNGYLWFVGYDENKNGVTDGTMTQGASALGQTLANARSVTFTTTPTTKYVKWYMTIPVTGINLQLELGTTPTPYVPYGYVGLEVTHDGTTTVTPIPLPSKGFAASLPDGTADALTVDSAGRWEWVNEIARIASYNGESVGNVYMSTTGQLTTGAEVYYKSAQASEHGYIDVPAIPDGSTVSIPELLEIGVAWFVHGAKELVEHATNERKRVEEALADVYEAIADL